MPVLVQNQPGGGGVIAGRAVTNAPPDGYNIAWAGNNTAIGVSLFREPLDPRLEMTPIVGVSEFAYLFVDAAGVAIQDAAAMDDRGPGQARHVDRRHVERRHQQSSGGAVVQIRRRSSNFTVVPYRGPSRTLGRAVAQRGRPRHQRLWRPSRSAIEAKQVRPLAVTSAARIPELPDVPTMKEAGVADFDVTSWNALYGPKGMPQQAIDVLARAATEILQRPDVIAQYKAIGFDAKPVAAAALDRRMRFEIDRWAQGDRAGRHQQAMNERAPAKMRPRWTPGNQGDSHDDHRFRRSHLAARRARSAMDAGPQGASARAADL